MPGQGIVGIMRRRPNGAARPLWMWGSNFTGSIGDATSTASRSSPVQTIAYGTTWASIYISVERNVVGATKTDGTLWLWGDNTYGQLGQNTSGFYTSTSSPSQTVAGGTNWRQVALGTFHTLAVKTDNTLWAWGYGGFGAVGNNTINNYSSPIQVGTSTTWSKVAAGLQSLAIKTDGTLWAWGWGNGGQLGNNTGTSPTSSPIQVGTDTTWSSVAAGWGTSAAIKTDGTLWTWGWNGNIADGYGKLGDNSIVHRSSPVQTVAGGTNWSQVSVGFGHCAAVKTDGSVWTWGLNTYGELGDNTTTKKSSPVQTVAFGYNWYRIAAGNGFTAAIKDDSTVWTWGYNVYGALADNTVVNRSSPVQMIMTIGTFGIIAAGSNTAGAIQGRDSSPVPPSPTPNPTPQPIPTTSGSLFDFGNNTNGSLGDNTTTHRSSPVQTTATGNTWRQASGGENHAIAIKLDGTLWTWGNNALGQLGDNTILHRSSPIQTVTYDTNWNQVAAGYRHSIGVKKDGTMWLWGFNTQGQLGDNSIVHRSSPVQTLGFAATWVMASAGKNHSSAIKSDGTLWSWGLGTNGQLGDNTATTKSSPIQTSTYGTNWKYVSCGLNYSAAVKFDGTIWCWGDNTYGQLGENSTTHRSSPIQTTAFGTNWVLVSCGGNTTYGIKNNGTLWGWGRNSYGQLGDNTTTHRSSPVQIAAATTTWTGVSGGYNHATAITNSVAWTWGRNNYGQCDKNDTVTYNQPRSLDTTSIQWNDVFAGSSSNATYTLLTATSVDPPSPPPTPTPTAPSPAPIPPGTPFAFASADQHLYKFYVVKLKTGKAAVACLEAQENLDCMAGPFDTFDEAKQAEIKFNSKSS